MPQIIDEKVDRLRLEKKMSIQKFAPYLNKILNAPNSQQQCQIITGWVEADTADFQACLERVAQNYFETDHVGVIEYLDCAKLYFMHRDQILNEWSRRLAIKFRKTNKFNAPATLTFILIYKPYKSSVDISIIKKITPEAVPSFPEVDTEDDRDFNGNGRSNNRLYRRPSGPETPEASLYSETSRSQRPPVFNIRPEFINMDSNSYNRRRGNSNSYQSRSPYGPRSNFPMDRSEHSNSRGQESSLEPGEVRGRAPQISKNRAPMQGGGQPNPFYLEYLKNKSNNPTLATSPIAQKYFGASPNRSYQSQSYSSQQGYGSRGQGGSQYQQPQSQGFNRGQVGFSYQKPAYQNVYKKQW